MTETTFWGSQAPPPQGRLTVASPSLQQQKGEGGGVLETESTSWTEEHEHKEEHETHGGGERETQ